MRITPQRMRLLTESNAKTERGRKYGYRTAVLHLLPHRMLGIGNVCPHASEGCAASCLVTSGRLRFYRVRNAMTTRTELFYNDRDAFLEMLREDIEMLQRRARKSGLKPAVRLNGTSDIPWERFAHWGGKNLMDLFPKVQFYDYTKNPDRALRAWSEKDWPKNYYLVFSRSEENEADVRVLIQHGVPIVMVLRNTELKKQWLKQKTIAGGAVRIVDGDLHDLTFKHPRNSVIVVRAKGRAKHDDTGFVIDWPLYDD